MKQLICAKEVEALEKQGQKVMYIDENTIVTPSARDAAAACGIEFSTEAPACCSEPAAAPAPCTESAPASSKEGIDSELIYKALTALMQNGGLNGVLESLNQSLPYVAEKDPQGFVKLVRGNTAKWEPLDTGNPSDKVFYNELIGADAVSYTHLVRVAGYSAFFTELCKDVQDEIISRTMLTKF